MNTHPTFAFAPLAMLLLAGPALAQTDSSRNDRNCTRSTLSTTAAAQCADDVLIDSRPDYIILTRPPPPDSAGGSISAPVAPAIQPGADVTGVGSPGAANNPGAASTGTSLTGTGAPSTSGAASMTGRR